MYSKVDLSHLPDEDVHALAPSQSLVATLLPEHKVTPLDMHEEIRLRIERGERKAVKRNYTELRRQQTGRGLTIALATPVDEVRTAQSAARDEKPTAPGWWRSAAGARCRSRPRSWRQPQPVHFHPQCYGRQYRPG
jgi:hypothetical protein